MNFKMLKRWWKTVDNIQDFDKSMLAEFGCRMCFNQKQDRHKSLYGKGDRPCIWKNENRTAEECFGCASLKATLLNFLKETR